MDKWILQIQFLDGTRRTESFDADEIGTIDDIWTGHMINEMDGIGTFTLSKVTIVG
jgi:hypothetical protein